MTSPVVFDPAEIELVKKAYVRVAMCGGDELEVAALAGVSLDTVNAVIEQHADLLQLAQLKFGASPEATEVLARKTQASLVRRIADVAAQANPLEAIEYLKPINKIIENADRVRMAEREVDKYANLPVIHITIGAGMAMTTTVIDTPAVVQLEDATDTVQDLVSEPVVTPVRTSDFIDTVYDLTPLPLTEKSS